MPHAHAEQIATVPRCWFIRVYDSGGYDEGSEYQASTVFRETGPGKGEFKGWIGTPERAQFRAIWTLLTGMGFESAIRTRRVPGRADAVRVYRRR